MVSLEKRDPKLAAAFSEFEESVTGYGLTARRGCTERYPTPNYSVATFHTEPLPAKGNKQLIEQLEADGFSIFKFWYTDCSTYRRSMRFQAEKAYVIPREEITK